MKNTAKNGGYIYNKPLVSFTGTDGKAFATVVNVYGTDTSSVTTGNVWFNNVLRGLLQTSGSAEFIATTDFEVDFTIANVSDSAKTSGVGTLAGEISPDAGETVTFTLIINGVYVKGGKALDKDANNLLASPAQLNVAVSQLGN